VVDKLSIIADELARTGNNIPNVADDGSDEWLCCSPAFDAAVQETIEAHSWNFDTRILPLVKLPTPPDDDLYQDAYAKPNQCLHLIWVRLNDQTVDWKIINDQICLTDNGYTPVAKFILDQGMANWPPSFTKIIRLYVRAAIYGGLHEDPQSALIYERMAQSALQDARTRVDQESPKRAPFNSRAIAARRVRRPWISTPSPWSGTDVPN
jgi:hypothetical protein